jgi:hypothetical protein
MKRIYTIHGVDAEKLESVKAEMSTLGAPKIRVVDCGDHYVALEGTHRLHAAHALGLTPELVILGQEDVVDITSFDWYESANWAETAYSAGEVAGELFSASSTDLAFDA